MEVGEVVEADPEVVLGQSGNEEEQKKAEEEKLVVETSFIYPDSLNCSTFYHGSDYFTSSFILSSKVTELKDRQSYEALLFIDRMCRFLIAHSAAAVVGDMLSTYQYYTKRYTYRSYSFQMQANERTMNVVFMREEPICVLSLNDGIFYKNYDAGHEFTNPDANLELWRMTVCKWIDKMMGSRQGKTYQSSSSPAYFTVVSPLSLGPELLVTSDYGKSFTALLRKTLVEYLTVASESRFSLDASDSESFRKGGPMGHQTEIILSYARAENFQCLIRVERKHSEDPAYKLEFVLQNGSFLMLHADDALTMDHQFWLRTLFLSVTRAWANPAQLVAYGIRDSRKINNAVKIERRVIEVEKQVLRCKVCEDKPIDWAYASCGHTLCGECAAKLQKVCPFCKADVKGNVKLFFG